MVTSGKNISDAFYVVKETLRSNKLFSESLISILEDQGYECINYKNLPLTDAADNNDLTVTFLWLFNRKNDCDDYVVMIDFCNVSNNDKTPVYSARLKNKEKSWGGDDGKWGEGGKGMSSAHLGMLKPFCLISEYNDDEKKELLLTNLNDYVEDVFIRINSLEDLKNEASIKFILDNFEEMQKENKGVFS